jgi:hypothetical protein
MIRLGPLSLGVALVVFSAWLAPTSAGEPDAATVIDRTLLCATSPSGGIREVEARANAGTRLRGEWVRLPLGAAATGNVTYALTDSLAWVTAGKPSAETTLDLGFRSSPVRDWGTLGVSRACRTVNAKIPLSHSGLKGGATSPLGARVDCPAPRRVLLRVRAVAMVKTDLRTKRDFLVTSAPLKSAQLAVRTEKGTPVMYTDVSADGRARLFTAKGCGLD